MVVDGSDEHVGWDLKIIMVKRCLILIQKRSEIERWFFTILRWEGVWRSGFELSCSPLALM